ncbi:MAG: CotH kinase family protein [Spirochaetales bacterium]|nr:CotH kinase family protein [Spirochaetales bacterium]
MVAAINGNILKRGFFLILVLCITAGCGEVICFSPVPCPDLGPITRIHVSLSPASLKKLYNSVAEDDYAPCLYEEDGRRIKAYIKVRGFTSRIYPKKSFTVKISTENRTIRYCLESFNIENRLVFFAYKKAGLCVPETKGAALFVNGEYIGCYTKIPIYNEDDLEAWYGESDTQLFKCHFGNMGFDLPLHYRSEKCFPDDSDFTTLDRLVYNVAHMGDEEWNAWMDEYIDKDDFIRYMVVHDFCAVRDTSIQNFYIYHHDTVSILPWDNGISMNPDNIPAVGGHNILTGRILENTEMKTRYNAMLELLFIQAGESNITDDMTDELERIYAEIDRAVYHEPTYYIDYSDFINKKNRLMTFLSERSASIPDPPLP